MRRRSYLALVGLSASSAGCVGVPARGELPESEPLFNPDAGGFHIIQADELYTSFDETHQIDVAEDVTLETAFRFGDADERHWVVVMGDEPFFDVSILFGLEQAAWIPFSSTERYTGTSATLSPAHAAIFEIRYEAEFQLWLDVDTREERVYFPPEHFDCTWSAHHVLLTDDDVLVATDRRDEGVC